MSRLDNESSRLQRYRDSVPLVATDPVNSLVRTLVALTPEQHEWLRRHAFDDRSSIAAHVRKLVQKAMDAEARSAARNSRAS
jgi:DNA-binding PadR family transcriptional regulator